MGIVNVTPDSFSDGGRYAEVESAVAHALAMLELGADIIDLGGESTRPDAVPVTAMEEQARVMPVLESILSARPEAIISIDTYHAGTARLAVEAGAEIVNDVSGHLWDSEMSATCAELRCGVILMHTRGRPQEWRSLPRLIAEEVGPMVMQELRGRVAAVVEAGVARNAIAVDPGFGFGKASDENFPLFAGLPELQRLGFPVVVGVSRKGFLLRALGGEPEGARSLVDATTAAHVAAVLGGTHLLRVHDVRAARAATAIADRVLQTFGEATETRDL